MVAVQHGGILRQIARDLEQVGVLPLAAVQRDLADGRAAGADGLHVLVPAGDVLADEAVGRLDDLRRGAVVLFEEQDLCAGVVRLKVQQHIRTGGAEAIDALILVTDEKQVPACTGQQRDDRMLDARGILCLVHAEVVIARLKFVQDLRDLPQDAQGIDHLVVIVHLPGIAQRLLIGAVERGEAVQLLPQQVQLLLAQHLIFYIGDERAGLLELGVRRVLALAPEIQHAQQGGLLCLAREQGKGGPSHPLLIGADDARRDAVDRAKLHPAAELLTEQGREAASHVAGGRDGIGHGEDLLRADVAALHEIAQPRHEYGRLAAAGDGQQQDGPLDRSDGCLLLRIKLQTMRAEEARQHFSRRHGHEGAPWPRRAGCAAGPDSSGWSPATQTPRRPAR